VVAAAGALLTLIPWVPAVIVGLAGCASGAFACQSAASSQVGKAAGKARSSAAGLYVGFYYLGGCVGSVLPGIFWKQAGWTGCVALMVSMQVVTAAIAYKLWKD
jgi:predicted MFS family arabinose efflux permease